MNGLDECESLFGVKLNKKITPIMVRDAIIECYYQADTEVLENMFEFSNFDSKEDKEETKRNHIVVVIKKFFDDVDGDYNNPTKESLKNVIDKCREFAKLFRDESIIQSNYQNIITLIDKID